jgi:glycosyltransferase involved in cell wall biosynthesis
MSLPLVSVTVPLYNSRAFIAESLESLLSQSYPNVEVIVVDDGSTDGTVEALRPYMNRIVYHRQENGGVGAARNTGMRLAKGQYIAWADHDDLCDRERLLTQVSYLAHKPEVVAVGSNFCAVDADGRVFDDSHAKSYYLELANRGLEGIFERRESFDGRDVAWLDPLTSARMVHWGHVWGRLLVGNFMHPPTMMIRSSTREKAGWLREDLRGHEDWEYITRVAKLGAVAFIDAPLLKYRRHSQQLSSHKSPAAIRTWLRVLESHLLLGADLGPDLRREIERELAAVHATGAYALGEEHKKEALLHLIAAARMSPREKRLLVLLARILVPAGILRLARRLRS